MPLSALQTAAINEVLQSINNTKKGKRQLTEMFLDLVDRQEWPQYYEIIPEPRCLNNIKTGVDKGRYKDATDVYTDISLVFWNAIFYNEEGSQIASDAETLKAVLEAEWKKRTVLPVVRSSPPPSSAQKVHAAPEDPTPEPEPPKKHLPAPVKKESTPAGPIPASAVPTRLQTPIASTSARPILPRAAPPARTSPDDMDVEMGDEEGGLEDGGGALYHPERDPLSEEIVKQLEKGLPRWTGFGDGGWLEKATPERIVDIVHIIKSHKDVVGTHLGACLESVPEESSPTLHLGFTTALSLKQIETRARHKLYKVAKDFDLDMSRLFLKARRFHEPASEAYGRTLLLQRLYQALTSGHPPKSPYVSSTNFAACRAGPGRVVSVHGNGTESDGVPNVTTHRILTKDRTFVEELDYKGWKVRVADWVHLANPDDPGRPIIGQVFRCWTSDEGDKKGRTHITVSWYYRPEQTFHTSNREFWEGEVFKTSHFADHPVEDIIEKIACQFTARHIRGRPKPPYWHVGFPLYVCDSRYNDRDRVFVRIKNWNSCVPEEVRQNTEFMPIYPFERIVYPPRVRSPFLASTAGKASQTKGPGGLLASAQVADSGETDQRKRVSNPTSMTPVRPTAAAGYAAAYDPSKGYPTLQAAAALALMGQTLPASTGAAAARKTPGPDRSVVTAAGGPNAGAVEKLPPETTKLFDRDPETNEVLWFAGPPLNQPRPRGARYSLAYMQFIAAKRKKADSSSNSASGAPADGDSMDVDGRPPSPKRPRYTYTPTVMETMREVMKDMEMHG